MPVGIGNSLVPCRGYSRWWPISGYPSPSVLVFHSCPSQNVARLLIPLHNTNPTRSLAHHLVPSKNPRIDTIPLLLNRSFFFIRSAPLSNDRTIKRSLFYFSENPFSSFFIGTVPDCDKRLIIAPTHDASSHANVDYRSDDSFVTKVKIKRFTTTQRTNN